MQNPRNLRVYGQAVEMALTIYQLTATFPATERFGFVTQMRRAAVSVGSNIAEGCGGNGNRALIAYLRHALGSLNELEFQLELSGKLGYCTAEGSQVALAEVVAVRRGIIALISRLRRRPDVHDV